MTLRPFLLAAAVLAAPACALSPPVSTPAQRVAALGEELVEREFDFAPISETYFQGPGPRAGRAYIDLSPGANDRQRAFYRDFLERLGKVPAEGFGEADRITHEMLRQRAQGQVAALEHPLRELTLLTPNRGIASSLLYMAGSVQPFNTEADFEAWLSRIESTAVLYGHAIDALKVAAKQGWTTPKPLVQKALAQLEAVASKAADQGPLWRPVAKYPKAAGEEKRAAYEKRYREALEQRHLPALRQLIAYVRDEYLPAARTTAGLGDLPGGDRAYRTQIRINTTLDRSPDELHALGLAEVARVRSKLLEVARPLGFRGEMKDFAAWLASNPAIYPFKTPDEVLDYLRRINARVVPELPKIFRRLPKSSFEIRLADPLVAASASASYTQPSADGLRPAIFTMPVVDPKRVASFGLTALLLHEGMPGHHLDIGRKVELDQPRFRKAFSLTVYSEGWGLYAEGLGQELGVYDDPWALLGRYSGELHRAARLVVDTGMHWKGWSREQAIRYLVEERGQTETGATVAIERYIGTPGQALAYKVGELEILKLREEARAALGGKFDLRDFHEAVLGGGQLTMALLRLRVQAWIASTQ